MSGEPTGPKLPSKVTVWPLATFTFDQKTEVAKAILELKWKVPADWKRLIVKVRTSYNMFNKRSNISLTKAEVVEVLQMKLYISAPSHAGGLTNAHIMNWAASFEKDMLWQKEMDKITRSSIFYYNQIPGFTKSRNKTRGILRFVERATEIRSYEYVSDLAWWTKQRIIPGLCTKVDDGLVYFVIWEVDGTWLTWAVELESINSKNLKDFCENESMNLDELPWFVFPLTVQSVRRKPEAAMKKRKRSDHKDPQHLYIDLRVNYGPEEMHVFK